VSDRDAAEPEPEPLQLRTVGDVMRVLGLDETEARQYLAFAAGRDASDVKQVPAPDGDHATPPGD
jgi:hypothetical protein